MGVGRPTRYVFHAEAESRHPGAEGHPTPTPHPAGQGVPVPASLPHPHRPPQRGPALPPGTPTPGTVPPFRFSACDSDTINVFCFFSLRPPSISAEPLSRPISESPSVCLPAPPPRPPVPQAVVSHFPLLLIGLFLSLSPCASAPCLTPPLCLSPSPRVSPLPVRVSPSPGPAHPPHLCSSLCLRLPLSPCTLSPSAHPHTPPGSLCPPTCLPGPLGGGVGERPGFRGEEC